MHDQRPEGAGKTTEVKELSPARDRAILAYLRREAAFVLALREEDVGVERPVTEFGMDSLKAVELRFRAEQDLGVEIPVESLAPDVTLTELARVVEGLLDRVPIGARRTLPPSFDVSAEVGRVEACARPDRKVTVVPPPAVAASSAMRVSILYFSTDESRRPADKYGLVLAGARAADRLGLDAVWLPERHFHPFGGVFPNPALVAAALAPVTERVRLRAGSVVAPLHDPLRIAEEWSVVDNLSGGRVDLGFAAGRNVADFALASPLDYTNRRKRTLETIETVRRLWRGEGIPRLDGAGRPVEVHAHPRPLQAEPGIWLTTSGPLEVFDAAGALGANVLTGLIEQTIDELGPKIAAYRAARVRHGHSGPGEVTVMLHTYLGDDLRRVRAKVREPFTQYLASFVDLWNGNDERSRFATLDERRRRGVLDFAFERYFQTSSLFGTVERALDVVDRLRAVGVTEIASLIDFGLPDADVLDGLDRLAAVKARSARALARVSA